MAILLLISDNPDISADGTKNKFLSQLESNIWKRRESGNPIKFRCDGKKPYQYLPGTDAVQKDSIIICL